MTINPQPLEHLKELHSDIADFMLAMSSRPDLAAHHWGPRERDAFEKARAAVNALPALLTSSSGIREQALEEAARVCAERATIMSIRADETLRRNGPKYRARAWREAANALLNAERDILALSSKPLDPPHRQQASDEADVNLAEARRMFVNGEFALSGYTNDQILHGDADHHYALQRTVKAIERGRQLAGGEDDPSVRLTAEYRAMSPLQKWETLCLHGLIDTNEPWIEDMRQSLLRQERQASPQSSSVHPDVERVAEEVTTAVYRKFKDWSKRGFTAEDVTWCEVKAEITRLVQTALSPANILHEASAILKSQARYALAEEILKPVGDPHVEDGSR